MLVVKGDGVGMGEEEAARRSETAVMDLVCTASLGLHVPLAPRIAPDAGLSPRLAGL
jgi:hypothetical protein